MIRRMRPSSLVGEAYKNVVSGTTRCLILAFVFVTLIGAPTIIDTRAMEDIVRQMEQFRSSGSTVSVLKATDLIDGRQCDGLMGAEADVGAIRQGETMEILNMPSSRVNVVEVTPGIIAMLDTIAGPIDATNNPTGGVWLSVDLASTLGLTPGQTLHTYDGSTVIAGIYQWPADGRARDLGYSILVPVVPDGFFSQCWAELWPVDQSLAELLLLSLSTPPTQAQVSIGQLNTNLGVDYAPATEWVERPTALTPWLVVFLGAGLGYLSSRLRRLEIASALHARVTRADLLGQHLLEGLFWISCASLLLSATLLVRAGFGGSAVSLDIAYAGVRTCLMGSSASLLGVLLGVIPVQERHLVRYTRER